MKSDADKDAGTLLLKSYGQFFKKQYHDFNSLSYNESWDENRTFLPIKTSMNTYEQIALPVLIASDNTQMTKVLSVLSALCIEIIDLKEEANETYFSFLATYDLYTSGEIDSEIRTVCDLYSFVIRCDDTLRNICNQLFAVYLEDVVNLNNIQLHFIINHVGELFTILVLIELLISNTSLPSNWKKFSKKLNNFESRPECIGHDADKLAAFGIAIDNITNKLMNDGIVQNSLSQLMLLRKTLVDKRCTFVLNEFSQYVKLAVSNLDKILQEKSNVTNTYKCIKINALFVLNMHLFGQNDKKLFKSLMELNTKAHSIHISGTTLWYPEQFLQRYAQGVCTNGAKVSQVMFKARQAYLSSKKISLSLDIASYQAICMQWLITVENTFSTDHNELNALQMSSHAQVILNGLDIASSLNYSLLQIINLHFSLGIPLSKSILMNIFEMIDMLKSLKSVILRNSNHISRSIHMIIQHLVFQSASSLLEIKKTLMSDKSYPNNRLDELTCLVIAERSLRGPATVKRYVAANIAMSFVPDTTYIEDTYIKLCTLLEKVQTLRSLFKTIEKLCDCSWIMWHQNIIPIYFQQQFSNNLNAYKLKHLCLLLEDCSILLNNMDVHFNQKKSITYINEMKFMFDECVLKMLSQNIETNLRIHIHSHLQMDTSNPFTTDMMKRVLLTMNNLRLVYIYMAVAPSVENYLSTMYYNLTTVVLSDWKTYGEMRQMAKFKFNLSIAPDNLPTQTLEQGLDVLEIMRNIHIFVSKYLYNLNNQIFIERSSTNKYLNSINITHIANSIRTHGTGIMNTTVNFTYQFLKKKFFTFSQFMYDEHIKSRLIKDLKVFKELSSTTNNMYPFKNADKFNKSIKILGLSENGQSYLDLFRDLISQIGNAMGYVRMIRSGGRHCCYDATVFLPNLEELKFESLLVKSNSNPITYQSSQNLDRTVQELVSNFLHGTEYFKLLVDVFAPVFRNPNNVHLNNFFIIIPPLTVNFVEHVILAKDKMSKKNKEGASFTDDGFAMGIAYILKLLEQDSNFESLHWFDSVWKYIESEQKSLDEQISKGSTQLQQALALSEKKIKTLEEEFKLLYYSLTSARIFFK